MMMEVATFVGNLAVATTVCLFLMGIPICSKIWKNNSTAGVSVLPFLTAFVSCFLWLSYGYLKNDVLLQLVNLFGFLAQVAYIGFYHYMSSDKFSVQKKMCATVAVTISIHLALHVYSDDENLTKNFGFVACVASLIFFASPLSNMVLVIRTQSTASMPLPLISLSFLQSTLWFIYGILIQDSFVQIPNVLGATITLLQLVLIFVIPERRDQLI